MIRKLCLLVIAYALLVISCVPPGATPQAGSPVTQPPVTEPPITEAPIAQDKNYFEGFPGEYQSINLPREIVDILNAGGSIVPLPSDPYSLQETLQAVAASFGYDLARYDLNRVVSFTSDEGYNYIAVPANPEFAASGCTGLIFDQKGAYSGEYDIYEVWFYEDQTILRDPKEQEIRLLKDNGEFFPAPPGSGEIPLVVFVHNGCWLCGCIFGKCGCIICK